MFTKPVCSTALLAVCAVLLTAPSQGRAVETTPVDTVKRAYEPVRVFERVPLDRPVRLRRVGDGFLLLDRGNHRLLELSASGSTRRQIGQVGQAPGELRFPRDYAIDGGGNIYVTTDTIPFAIHRFTRDGKFLNVIYQGTSRDDTAFYSSSSIAVDDKGTIYLSQPRQGHLLTTYSPRGGRLGGIGDLVTPNDLYTDCGAHSLCRNRRFSVTLNRVLSAIDHKGGVVVAFSAAPLLRRYSAKGQLTYETRFKGGLIDTLIAASWKDPESWREYHSSNSDGVQVLRMITSVSVDSQTGLTYCLVGGEELFVFSPEGRQLAILNQRGDGPPLESVSVSGSVAHFTDSRYLYRAELPAVSAESDR